jgi:N-acetylglucosaminyldiphosphoundecaprenol N-acetyl-beta-D-mannosaminyltransferase
MKINATPFLNYNIYSAPLSDLPNDRKLLVNTINQYSFCIAEEDNVFKEALLNSDILLPDGVGVVWATKFLSGAVVKKIAGADIHAHYLQKLNRTGGKCFYLGASNETLIKIKQKISIDFPNVQVGIYSPPFKPQFTEEDNIKMINAVNTFQPEVLFVGMTAPKQEKWAYEHLKHLNCQAVCTIGAVFDFYAGTVNRPNKFWINLGLEWFVRLLKEPKRMWKRYVYYGPIFIKKILIMKKKVKKF